MASLPFLRRSRSVFRIGIRTFERPRMSEIA